MHTSSRRSAVCALGLLLSVSPVFGSMLATGGTLYPAPLEANPAPGVVIYSTGSVPFVAATFTGSLTSAVIAGDPTNPLGGLTFVYRVTNNAGSPNDIGRLTVVDFTGWLTDASYDNVSPVAPLPAAGTVAPALINRSTPDVVGFSFLGIPIGPGTLAPGKTSMWLVVQTNAPTWKTTIASVIDGSVAMVPSVGPAPEPATLLFFGAGAVALLRRRS